MIFLLMIENLDDRSKLEKIYIQYHRYMYYIASDILQSSHEAQDAVQTSILKLVNYLDKIDDVSSAKTKHLVAAVIRSTAIDIIRKQSKVEYFSPELAEIYVDASTPNSEDIVIRLGEIKALSEKLTSLKPEYTDVLTLKYYHDLSDKEIADLLSISHENVRARLSRAKSALKKMMLADQSYEFNLKGMCEHEI